MVATNGVTESVEIKASAAEEEAIAIAIVEKNHKQISAPSTPMMNQWSPRKEDKLFRRRTWVSITQPSTCYDQEEVHSFSLPRRVKIKRTTVDSMYHSLEAQSVVMARAKDVQAKLSPSYPSLIKVMLPSHVSGGFWLGLPKVFCDNHLPKQDTAMVLEDESGIEYQTKFIPERTGLSAGWRGFSMAHKLLQGDVIVFHLVMPNKFMVYIVRSNVDAEVVGAVGLGFKACNKQTPLYSEEYIRHIKEEQMTLDDDYGKATTIASVKEEENDNLVSLATHIYKEHEQTSSHVHFETEMLPVLEESENVRSFGSNFMNGYGIRLSDSTPHIDEVKRSNDFSISVNGLITGSEFYYENGKETNIAPVKEEENDDPVALATHIHKGKEQTSSHVHLDTEMQAVVEESENDRSFGSNYMNGIRLSGSTLDFDKVNSSNDYNISVNGSIIDSEFSSQVRTKYYELCCSQNSFLHDHILESLNYKLVSEIISETINIADAIRACKNTTPQEHLTTWDKTLMAFEGLGMNVGFLRARICQLLMLSLKPAKKREAELKRESTQQEICILVAKIMDARATIKQLEAEIQCLDADIENMEKSFREVASAPW